MPSTKISRLGFTPRTASPARSAASRQSIGGVAAAPAGGAVRLVVQVDADHGGLFGVAGGKHRPGRRSSVASGSRWSYQSADSARRQSRAMAVQDDLQADLAGVVDDLVHDLQAGEALQVGVHVEVDAVWNAAGLEDWSLYGSRMAL